MSEFEEHKIENQEFKYWAFISYSHKDEQWAKWLHESLETYSVPSAIVGRDTGKHGKLPRRIFPVFRDRDELPGAADLGGKIKNALSESRNLIVVCSTSSATSKWVNEEIKTYKAMGRDDRVLCLIIDGEPNATDYPEREIQECFPPALRFRVTANGELSDERAEPIAADVRKGKDGRRNAKLKLLSGLLDVGYDELRQRDKRRRTRRRVINIGAIAFLTVLIIVGYVALTDAGVSLPGRDSIQTLLDRRDMSVMRRAPSLEQIRAQAIPIRRTLVDALNDGRTPDGWIKTNLNPAQDKWVEVWSHSQSLCGIFKSLEVSNEEARTFLPGLDLPFTSGAAIEKDGLKFGWQSHKGDAETIAEPALWTAAALAAALARPDFLSAEERRRYEGYLAYTQEVLRLYRPLPTGGWNMFPQQKEPELHNPYTTALALLALLETRKAGLPWDGSTERRDELLKETALWLISKFDAKARMEGKRPGWHGVSESANQIFDGLTLQIYAELLRAEAEAGIELPPEILEQIPIHLISCIERDLNFPVASGEFSARITDHTGRDTVGKESVGFLWYPWAIDAGMRWLERAEKRGAPPEELVRVRRAVGHLVVIHGQDAANKARTDWTFIGAEFLYGISTVAAPTR